MASNNSYNYNYQQTTAQQYPAYKTASAANDGSQVSRQYQQHSASQGTDYMPYQGQSYGTQASGYNVGHGNSWDVNSHGGARERTSLAAEALRNMSNHSYTPTSTSSSHSGFPATSMSNTQSLRHGSAISQPPQAQPRPRSVNTNRVQATSSRNLPSPASTTGFPPQQMQNSYSQQQRPASHTQYQSSNMPARNDGLTTATTQHNQSYDPRPLSDVDAIHQSQNSTPSVAYGYDSTQTLPHPGPIAPPVSSIGDSYLGQTSTTVDPTAVYDPWPEYQRKAEALRVQKAAEEAALAEEQRRSEEARKAEEVKKEEERRRQEEAERIRAAEYQTKQNQMTQKEPAAAPTPEASEAGLSGDNILETEIRAMMAKMRELNSKDPALLARIWEEERRAKVPSKSTAVQNKPAPQRTTAPVATPVPPPTANQSKKAAPREIPAPSAAKPATHIPAAAATARPHAQTVPSRSGGTTIWPQEKKAELAYAATTYLDKLNPNNRINSSQVLAMLDGNPSYIELCQQLEHMGLKLDRAAFAKNLLSTIPDLNATRKPAPQPAPTPAQKAVVVPPAVMKTPAATDKSLFSSATYVSPHTPYTPGPAATPSVATPAPVAEMVPIKAELKPPANKEEAARKRNLADLVDLTLLSDEENLGPPPKKLDTHGSPHPHVPGNGNVDSDATINNFPSASMPARPANEPAAQAVSLPPPLPHVPMAVPLQKRHALRRNSYNPATIARDVLLACGRHPSERQLNQHLDVLRINVPQVQINSDLTTIRWDILDPGKPPPGYFKDSVQALAEDADDEEDSEPENHQARPRASADLIGGEGGAQARVQALPAATNPFQKRRGRPPKRPLPDVAVEPMPSTSKTQSDSPGNMRASAPRSSPAGVGYSSFRVHGPDGQPLPKKRGRPIGWRKAIHGSPTAISNSTPKKGKGSVNHTPTQPSSLRAVRTGDNEPIPVESRSPSVANHVPKYHSFKCRWQNCPAELHNLATLKKHVFKMHRKQTMSNTLECLWDVCGEREKGPSSFDLESNWKSHIQQNHFDPLSWELGDGPASGLSGNED